ISQRIANLTSAVLNLAQTLEAKE
ncbi:hypothetical protein LCGC14_2115980, partial [marine sediment metagenome]